MSEEAKKTSFDLAALDTTDLSETGSWLHLMGPRGEDLYVGKKEDEKPVRILLIGEDSKEYQSIDHEQNNIRLRNVAKGGRRLKNLALSEDVKDGNIFKMIKCTKGWENMIVDGVDLECTPANARIAYERFNWIREQAWDHVHDRSNYLGN